MRESKLFQEQVKKKLKNYFNEVEKEWNISRNATDIFRRDNRRYAPRLDIAVGPFNIIPGNIRNKIHNNFYEYTPQKIKGLIKSEGLSENDNPRCALAVEIVFSGSSKHILGDITNASMMGLYGFVVAKSEILDKVKRIFEYTKAIKDAGKAPSELFANVSIISSERFLELL